MAKDIRAKVIIVVDLVDLNVPRHTPDMLILRDLSTGKLYGAARGLKIGRALQTQLCRPRNTDAVVAVAEYSTRSKEVLGELVHIIGGSLVLGGAEEYAAAREVCPEAFV